MSKTKPKIYIASTALSLFSKLAALLQEMSVRAQSEDRYLSIALPGGSTPKKFYEYLSGPVAQHIIWDRIHFYWGDERCVPPESPESNYGMTAAALLNKIKMSSNNIHRIHGENNPEEEVKRYAYTITRQVPGDDSILPRFDWIILGLGTDGHTASLFPPLPPVQTKGICTLAIHPQSGQNRISLTLPVINNSRRISFLVTGQAKSEIIASILKHDSVKNVYPAAQVQPVSGILEWFLDKAAGSLL